jgi:hypothetical protein
MVQTMGLVVCAGIAAWRGHLRRDARVLRVGVFRDRPWFAFSKRHALRCISIFHVRIFVVGLDWRENEQLN